MYYDPFVLPFTLGMSALLIYLAVTYIRWIRSFPPRDRRTIRKNILSRKTLKAGKEIFMECLVHHKIFRTHPFLGYMHMCFGLGWFLLIVIGKIESVTYHPSWTNPPYYAIFFRFFHPAGADFPGSRVFAFLMDLVLLTILSGLLLAWLKRLYSRLLGMRRTTNHRPFDRLILTTLWLIFPLRFLAESFTAALRGGGGFLTQSAGELLSRFLPVDQLFYPAWWAYSSALGLFFVLLPFSRYMHIPTEMVYILLKNWGIRQGDTFNAFSRFQLYACSRCGICLDRCQLGSVLNIRDTQPVYFLRKIRHGQDHSTADNNCLLCGRCEEACPVDLRLNALRLTQRPDRSHITKETYAYIPTPVPPLSRTRVAYFAGCMGQLTPGVTRSMCALFDKAGIAYTFIDEQGGICCGRPMLLSGNRGTASVLMAKNKAAIQASGAELLVTSCPICYKTFKENYGLDIPVLHHSEYINRLIEARLLQPRRSDLKTVFHSPCELGRGSGVYAAPKAVLHAVSHLQDTALDDHRSLCCGGSLANTVITPEQRTVLAKNALDTYLAYRPDLLVTACPLCKKTFGKNDTPVPVKDLAEIVAENC